MTFQQIYEAISALPLQERLRLVERVVHDAVEPSKSASERTANGSPLDGLFSDIPDLVEEVCAEAYRNRKIFVGAGLVPALAPKGGEI